MSHFPSRPPSSFSRYSEPKSPQLPQNEFQLQQFSKLNLNSQKSHSSGLHSNLSLFLPPLPLLNDSHDSDLYSLRSRNRKNSSQIGWKNSIPGNLVFPQSIAGRSSLYHNDDFHLDNFANRNDHMLEEKELSQKSCPVGNQESQPLNQLSKIPKAYEQGHIRDEGNNQKQKIHKKFLKTKNLLRTLSTYLHKYIKYNHKSKKFVDRYCEKKFPNWEREECDVFFSGFLQWIGGLNMTNFQEYQKTWVQDNRYLSIYRQLTLKYYIEQAYCDIYNSRLTSKQIYQEYLPQFIQGLLNPKTFTHFHSQ